MEIEFPKVSESLLTCEVPQDQRVVSKSYVLDGLQIQGNRRNVLCWWSVTKKQVKRSGLTNTTFSDQCDLEPCDNRGFNNICVLFNHRVNAGFFQFLAKCFCGLFHSLKNTRLILTSICDIY